MTGPGRRVLAALGLVAGTVVLSIAAAAPASAHATVVGTDPSDASRLPAAPTAVTVTFSESVGLGTGYLKVVDGNGDTVSTGAPTHPGGDGTKVSVALRPGLGDGSYVASYRIVSTDSHPIGGAFSFVVGDGPLVAASGVPVGGTTDQVVETTFTIARWISFAGMVLFGGLAFVVLCWPAGRTSRRARRLIWTGWAGAVAGAILGLLLEGPYAAGTGLSDAVDVSLLQATLGTTYGRMLCARLVLLGALAFLAARLLRAEEEQPERARARDEDLAAISGLGVLATYGGVGHAAAGSQPTLALLSDTSHLAAASLWIGGLAVMLVALLPTRRADDLAQALPRFSRIAMGSVAVLVVTGTYQAWREVWPLPALWSTGYGRLLLLKIAGFVLLLALGNLSRVAVRRRYAVPVAHALSMAGTGSLDSEEVERVELDRMVGRLRRSVFLEVAVAAAVLAVTAVLVSTAPGRGTYADPFSSTAQLASGGSARISVDPARTGENTVEITLLDRSGKPVDAQNVSLTAALPAQQIGPLQVALTRAGTGVYRAPGASFAGPGRWELVLRVQTSEFDRDVTQVDVPVT
ncbi:MAG TPA: FixH family protein [Mycobacteriales bacterium]